MPVDPSTARLMSTVRSLERDLDELRKSYDSHDRKDLEFHVQMRERFEDFHRRLQDLEEAADVTGKHQVEDLKKKLSELEADKRASSASIEADRKKKDDEKRENRRAWMRLVGAAFLGALATATFAALARFGVYLVTGK